MVGASIPTTTTDRLGKDADGIAAEGTDRAAVRDHDRTTVAPTASAGPECQGHRRAAAHRTTTTADALGIDAVGRIALGHDHAAVRDVHIAGIAATPAAGTNAEGCIARVARIAGQSHRDATATAANALGKHAMGLGAERVDATAVVHCHIAAVATGATTAADLQAAVEVVGGAGARAGDAAFATTTADALGVDAHGVDTAGADACPIADAHGTTATAAAAGSAHGSAQREARSVAIAYGRARLTTATAHALGVDRR